MRFMLTVLLFTSSAAISLAQGPLYKAEVIVDGIALRAGPSDTMPDTGTIFRGQKVIVDHELGDGWLAIEPPRGQVSWINHRFVEILDNDNPQVPRNAVVHSEGEVDLATGRPGEGRPLRVRRTRIPNETIVLIIGQKVQYEGSTWYPIEPPDGDLRYVPRSAIRYLKAQPSQSFVVHSPKPTGLPESKGSTAGSTVSLPPRTSNTTSRGPDWPNHTLWQQAQQAERAGDYQRAETLYLRLAAEMNQAGGDQELANLCYTQVHAVREKMRNPNKGTPPNRSEPPKENTVRWVGPGTIRVAGFRFDNRITFALLDSQNRVICYAINGPGVDLENFIRREVDIYGNLSFPGELRGVGVVSVTRVQPTR